MAGLNVHSPENVVRKYECLICLELLLKPKVLPCQGIHTFCEHCIQNHMDRFSFYQGRNQQEKCFLCPVCKGQVAVPSKGAAGFQTNYYISEEVDQLRKDLTQSCAVCCTDLVTGESQQATASRVCCDCDSQMCRLCATDHGKRFPAHTVQRIAFSSSSLPVSFINDSPESGDLGSSTHPKAFLADFNINAEDELPPTDINSATQLKRPDLNSRNNTEVKCPLRSDQDSEHQRQCGNHPSERLRFYCFGNAEEWCHTIICRDCRMTEHFHHNNVTDLAKMAALCQQRLQIQEAAVEARVQALTNRSQKLELGREVVLASKNQVATLLDARTDALISAIRDYKAQALSRLDARAEEEDRKFREEMEMLRGTECSLRDVLATMQRAARASCDVTKVRLSVGMGCVLDEEGGEEGVSEEEGRCEKGGEGVTKGFLLNTGRPVKELLSVELMERLLGKVIRL